MMVSFKKFQDILSGGDLKAADFFDKNAKNLLKDDRFLRFLLKGRWSEKKYDRLSVLAWIIVTELNGWRAWGEEKHFDVASVCEDFCDYMQSDCFYMGARGVPFEKWDDIAREKIENLKVFVENKQLKHHRRTKLWKGYCDKYIKRRKEFERTIPGYDEYGYPSGLL